MEQPEILRTAVGLDNIAGAPVLTVYIDRDTTNVGEVIRNLPQEIRGVRVQIEPADEIRAMGYTARQTIKTWLKIVRLHRSAISTPSCRRMTKIAARRVLRSCWHAKIQKQNDRFRRLSKVTRLLQK
jgi:hypothetical protein